MKTKILYLLIAFTLSVTAQTRRSAANSVPYSGATSDVDLNAKKLANLSNLRVGSAGTNTIPIQYTDGATTYETDTDPVFVSARTFNPATSSNGHGFVYADVFTKSSNGLAMNAYRDNSKYGGTANYDHHSAFECNFNYNSTGTLSRMYNIYDGFRISSGITTDKFGLYGTNATGSGTLTNQYFVYCSSPYNKATGRNEAIHVEPSIQSWFGGPIQLATTASAANSESARLEFSHGGNPGTKTSFISSRLLTGAATIEFNVSNNSFGTYKKLIDIKGDVGSAGVDSVNVRSTKFYCTSTSVKFTAIPTSSAGLTSGAVWSNAGVLSIVP